MVRSCSILCGIMSSRASGAGRKRRRQEKEDRGEPATSMQLAAHPEPLPLLAVAKLFYGMLVWLQLCNAQGVAQFSFVQLPPRVPRPWHLPSHGLSRQRPLQTRLLLP